MSGGGGGGGMSSSSEMINPGDRVGLRTDRLYRNAVKRTRRLDDAHAKSSGGIAAATFKPKVKRETWRGGEKRLRRGRAHTLPVDVVVGQGVFVKAYVLVLEY